MSEAVPPLMASVKGEHRDVAAFLLEDNPADHRAVLVPARARMVVSRSKSWSRQRRSPTSSMSSPVDVFVARRKLLFLILPVLIQNG